MLEYYPMGIWPLCRFLKAVITESKLSSFFTFFAAVLRDFSQMMPPSTPYPWAAFLLLSLLTVNALLSTVEAWAVPLNGNPSLSDAGVSPTPYRQVWPLAPSHPPSGVSKTALDSPTPSASLPQSIQKITLVLPPGWTTGKLQPLMPLIARNNLVTEVVYWPQWKNTVNSSVSATLSDGPVLVPLTDNPSLEDLETLRTWAMTHKGLIFFSAESDSFQRERLMRFYMPLFQDLGLMAPASPANTAAVQQPWSLSYQWGEKQVFAWQSPYAIWVPFTVGGSHQVALPPVPTPPKPPKVLTEAAKPKAILTGAKPKAPSDVADKGVVPSSLTKPESTKEAAAVAMPSIQEIQTARVLYEQAQQKYQADLETYQKQVLILETNQKQESKAFYALLEASLQTQETRLAWQNNPQWVNRPSALLNAFKEKLLQPVLAQEQNYLQALDISSYLGLSSALSESMRLSQEGKASKKALEQARSKEEATRLSDQASHAYQQAYLAAYPSSPIEVRGVWLDRGAMVQAASPEGLRQMVRKLAQTGFNVVYVETLNGGYSLYPSSVFPKQNPQFQGWDPIAVVIEECHKLGIEAHAWVWCFAVGNTRLNTILGLPSSYPGPILSQEAYRPETLILNGGRKLAHNQHEYWLSPASLKGQRLLIDAYKEIVTRYPFDGLQLDYVRYPFQKPGDMAGFEGIGAQRFQSETGLSVNNLSTNAAKAAWRQWKTDQVNRFVQQTSQELKALRPNLTLSAAVFPMPRDARLRQIQQDWSLWLKQGWLDILTPMTYAAREGEFGVDTRTVFQEAPEGSIIYPGIGLHLANPTNMMQQILLSQSKGYGGHTLFATSQLLEQNRLDWLAQGSYRQSMTGQPFPHRNPLLCLRVQLEWVQSLFEKITPRLKQTSVSYTPAAGAVSPGGFSTASYGVGSLAPSPQTVDLALLRDWLKQFQGRVEAIASQDLLPRKAEWLSLKQQWKEQTPLFSYWARQVLPHHEDVGTYLIGQWQRVGLLLDTLCVPLVTAASGSAPSLLSPSLSGTSPAVDTNEAPADALPESKQVEPSPLPATEKPPASAMPALSPLKAKRRSQNSAFPPVWNPSSKPLNP
jgi:uncharacterized lipoprotein YddW (UPF0748 family)